MSGLAPPITGVNEAEYAHETHPVSNQEYVSEDMDNIREKRTPSPPRPAAPPAADDEDEDEDMDALIAELESQDGAAEDEEEGSDMEGMSAKPVPEELLQTDTRTGLSDAEVQNRKFYSYLMLISVSVEYH